MRNTVWMSSRCSRERPPRPASISFLHANLEAPTAMIKPSCLQEMVIIEWLRAMTSNESQFCSEWAIMQPSFTHVGMRVTHLSLGFRVLHRSCPWWQTNDADASRKGFQVVQKALGYKYNEGVEIRLNYNNITKLKLLCESWLVHM